MKCCHILFLNLSSTHVPCLGCAYLARVNFNQTHALKTEHPVPDSAAISGTLELWEQTVAQRCGSQTILVCTRRAQECHVTEIGT